MATLTDRIIGVESGGNALARNPRSSAAGAGQFLGSTWLSMIQKYRPDLARGKTREQILQLRFDPALSREMTDAYAAENAQYLQARGIDPTPANTYLAHFAGPSGAAALHANPQASVEATLGSSAVAANPFLRGKTGSDVIAWADRKMGTPAQAMAEGLRKRFGTKTEGGTVVASSGQDRMAGGEGVDRLKSAMTYDPAKMDAYSNLAKTGQDVASKATNWQTALAGVLTSGVGGYLQGREGENKKAAEAAIAEVVQTAQSPTELARILVNSPDERIRAAGLELLAKNVGQAPQSRIIEGPYGQKIHQDFVNGQWVTSGSGAGVPDFGSQQPAQAPQTAVIPAPVPMSAPQQGGAMAPSGPMLGGPSLQTENIGEIGASGIPQPQPRPRTQQPPAQVQQAAPAPEPQFRIGPSVPKPPEGYVHKLSPDGRGYLWGTDGQPIFEPKTAADERGKSAAGLEEQAQSEGRVSQQFAGGLEQLSRFPGEFGRMAFERALGPWSAETPDAGTTSSAVGAAFAFLPQQIARGYGEVQAAVQGGAAPTEVRDRINTATKNLAAVMKPLIRKPGEGAWSDKDQANLEAQLGNLQRARSVEEYERRLQDIQTNISKVFRIPVPEIKKPERSETAPGTAEDEQRRFYEEYFARNGLPAYPRETVIPKTNPLADALRRITTR